jgi:hypothetical protein
MDLGLVRLWDGGIEEQEQKETLKSFGVSTFADTLDQAVQLLKQGDRLIIAEAVCLGSSSGNVLSNIQTILAHGCSILDIQTNESILPNKEVKIAISLAKRAEKEARDRQASLMRKAEPSGGAPRKLTGETLLKAKALWNDTSISGQEAANQAGVSKKTMERTFGRRT